MNMDALTAIENFASSIFSAGMDFLFTWGEFIGVISMITLFARARSAGPVKCLPEIYCGDVNQLHARITPGND